MDLQQAGAGQEFIGRSESFNMGSGGMPYRVATSFGQDSARFNDQVGKNFTPESVLNQTVRSPNGMSVSDYSRILTNGAMLPDANGMSADTSQGIAKILLDGRRTIGTL